MPRHPWLSRRRLQKILEGICSLFVPLNFSPLFITLHNTFASGQLACLRLLSLLTDLSHYVTSEPAASRRSYQAACCRGHFGVDLIIGLTFKASHTLSLHLIDP